MSAETNTQTRLTIVTQFCSDDEGQEGSYAQVSGLSSGDAFKRVYYCSLLVMLHSMRLQCTSNSTTVYFNSAGNEKLDGIPISDHIAKLGAHFETLPFCHVPPLELGRKWRATFYKLDVLAKCAAEVFSENDILLLDSDCLITGSINEVFTLLQDHDIIAYDPGFSPEKDINGISRNQLLKLYADFGARITEPPPHYGGEFLAIRNSALTAFTESLETLWRTNCDRAKNGKTHFLTEEHLFSFVLNSGDFRVASASNIVKRIWTQRAYSNTTAKDVDLPIWHVPAEKQYGLLDLYRLMRTNSTLINDSEGFTKIAAELCGLGHRSLQKRTRDIFRRIARLMHND